MRSRSCWSLARQLESEGRMMLKMEADDDLAV